MRFTKDIAPAAGGKLPDPRQNRTQEDQKSGPRIDGAYHTETNNKIKVWIVRGITESIHHSNTVTAGFPRATTNYSTCLISVVPRISPLPNITGHIHTTIGTVSTRRVFADRSGIADESTKITSAFCR